MPIFTEHELIPFETSPPPPGPWLVLAPHPDDEAFGLGGTLLRGKKEGVPFTIAYVTLGEAAGEPSVRQEEAVRAARALGAQEAIFFGLPDRRVYKHLDVLALKLKKLFKQKFKTVFTPSLFEFHPDHRATTLAVLATAPFLCQVWLYEISRQGEVNRLVDVSAVYREKEEVMRIYASQLAQNRYLEITRALNLARTYTLSGVEFAEGFFAARAGLLVRRYAAWLKKYFPSPSTGIKISRQ